MLSELMSSSMLLLWVVSSFNHIFFILLYSLDSFIRPQTLYFPLSPASYSTKAEWKMAEMYDRNRKQNNQSARARGNAEINIQQGRIFSTSPGKIKK